MTIEAEEVMSDVWAVIDVIKAKIIKGLSDGSLAVGVSAVRIQKMTELSPIDKKYVLERINGFKSPAIPAHRVPAYRIHWIESQKQFEIRNA